MSVIALLGAAVLALSVYRVIHYAVGYEWLILAYLTVLTGAFTVKIPRVNSKFTTSDAFVFINTILFGTAAGVLTAALDGFIGSIRCKDTARRAQTIPFNTAVFGLSAFAGGETFFRLLGRAPLSQSQSVPVLALVLPFVLSVLAYYLCNSVFVAAMLSLESGENAFHLWRQAMFTTLATTYVGAAAGAVIAFNVRSITPTTLLIVVPILIVIYFMCTIYLEAPPTDTNARDEVHNLKITLRPAYRRFHYFLVALGLGFIVLLLFDVFRINLSYTGLIIALLASLAGLVTVQMPGVKIKFSVADIFVFANVILFGPVIGAITAALDGLVGSVRARTKARRAEYTEFNIAGMAISAYIAGEIFFKILGRGPMFQDKTVTFGQTFLPAIALAISYYVLNTMAIAIIIALQKEQNAFRVWRENLLAGMTTDVNCALGAVFVASGISALTPTIAIAVLLILAVVYASLKALAQRMPQSIPSSD
jgi:uncharacterized membrane protein